MGGLKKKSVCDFIQQSSIDLPKEEKNPSATSSLFLGLPPAPSPCTGHATETQANPHPTHRFLLDFSSLLHPLSSVKEKRKTGGRKAKEGQVALPSPDYHAGLMPGAPPPPSRRSEFGEDGGGRADILPHPAGRPPTAQRGTSSDHRPSLLTPSALLTWSYPSPARLHPPFNPR